MNRLKLEEASVLAEDALKELKPYCTRIEVAGGVRRRKPDPHDIELVCVPAMAPKETDLFGFPAEYLDRLYATLSTSLPAYGEDDYSMTQGPPDKAGKKAPCGPRYYRLMYKGERLDVFAVLPPAQWGVVFTLRTGDAGFSHWLVSQGWRKGLYFIDGAINRVRKKSDGTLLMSKVIEPGKERLYKADFDFEAVPTPEEKDVFEVLGVEWKDPEQRVTEQAFQTW